MNTYNDNKNFLYKNKLVSPKEIYEFDGKRNEKHVITNICLHLQLSFLNWILLQFL